MAQKKNKQGVKKSNSKSNTKPSAAKPAKKPALKTAASKPAPKPAGKSAAGTKPVAKKSKEEILKAAVKGTKTEAKAALQGKALDAAPAKVKVDKKATAAKNKNKKEKEEVELEDDFISDDLGSDEIGEYEEELKAVETLDIETEEEIEWSLEVKSSGDEEIFLTDAEGNRYCRAKDCDQIAAVDSYCRFHYLMYWKRIQVRKKILADGKLEKYVEELTARYPDKFLEMIRRDLRTQKDFLGAIQELEIDESELNNEAEDDTQSFIDEVRGLGGGESPAMEDEEF